MFDMLGNVIKNLFSRPATRMYPFEKRASFKGTRGQIKGINIDDCIFCGICSKKCPADAIKVSRDEKSWEIDKFRCVICGACTEACPKKCIIMDEAYKEPVYKKDECKFVKQPTVG